MIATETPPPSDAPRVWPLSAPLSALLRLARRNIVLHRLRSTLSILGVVFGVAAVVAMSSVGEGARREALSQVAALGIDTIALRAAPVPGRPLTSGLALGDVQSLRLVVPHALAAAALREATLGAQLGDRRGDVSVVGTTAGYAQAASLSVSNGRFLSALDLADSKRVAVLGATVAQRLFPLGEARGQPLRLGEDWYRVVGVLAGRGASRKRAGPIRTRDIDQTVFVPLATLGPGAGRGAEAVDEIVLRVNDGRHVTRAAEVAQALLRRRYPAQAFAVVVPREILRQKARTQRIFNVVTGAVAAIGLLVGGIGIMNIMLATVAEREREIGVRRAVGATQADIAAQFLAESSLLTCLGGAAGAVLGAAGSFAIQVWAEWPTALSPFMLAAALLTAGAVGIGFGFYPAWRAARLTPMEALRSE
jgi:putative ABC transport system permease protein